jgi:hypothetical protein
MTVMIEKVYVPSADDMDDETFMKHMNLRHYDSIGGLHSLWLVHPSVTDSWRAFHARLHANELSHEHYV